MTLRTMTLRNMNLRSIVRLVLCLMLCLAIGFVGAQFTAREIPTWYASLAKPSWTPPPAVFPVVWTILYVLIAVSLWRLWERAPASRRGGVAVLLFFAQLVLNAIWTPVFFGLHATRSALAIIVVLLGLIAATIVAMRRIDRPAALLLVPYLLWVAYAATLNGGIVALN